MQGETRWGSKTSIQELAHLLLKLTAHEDLGIHFEPAGPTFVSNRVGSTEAAKHQLGFEWSVELEEGMRSLIHWRQAHKEQVAANRSAADSANKERE